MKKKLLLLLLFYSFWGNAQNAPTVFIDIDTPLPACNTGDCVDLVANYLQTYSTVTNNYTVSSIPFAPGFPVTGGTVLDVTVDDIWSPIFTLPFPFCFYGQNYNQLLVGANGVLTFDIAGVVPGGTEVPLVAGGCDWSFTGTIPSTTFPIKRAIYGVYQDIHPGLITTPATQNINYYVTGTAPNRAFVLNTSNMPQFSCNTSVGLQTYQIILYETTNIIDVLVHRRTACTGWNGGRGLIGVMDETGTLAATPATRNTGTWSATNEAWRFSPSSVGASNVTIEWFNGATSLGPGVPSGVGMNTLNVCPTGPTTYTAVATYMRCDGVPVPISANINVGIEPALPVLDPQDVTICTSSAGPYTFNINQNAYMLNTGTTGYTTPGDFVFDYYVDAAGVPGAQIPNASLAAYTPASSVYPQTIWVSMTEQGTVTGTGCTNLRSFVIDVTASPSGTFSYTGSPYCSDDATSHLPTLSGLTTGGTYSYAVTPPGPGTLILDATTGAITPLGSTFNTTYIVSYDIPASATCPAYHTEALPITINFCVTCTTTASNSGPICSGDNFNLFATNAGAGATYAWTGPNGFTSTDQNPVGVPSPTGAAPYVYTVVATIGGIPCSTATTTVVLNPIITPAFTAVAAICSGGTLSALPTTSNNGITGSWAPALDNTTTTTYTFTPTAGQCATIQTMSITVTPNVTPTFTAVAAICSGATLSALPTTSIEGITGTWAPALNNTATTTYTFTPTAGQCAVTQTMSITVTPNATPTFTPVAAICSGAALAPLPTTSIEGITGTWAPALNNTATTTYTFTPTAGICAVTQTMSITVNPITTPTFTPVAAICSGGTLSALPTTSIEGITGSWAPALNNTATTTYTFTPTAGQCAVTQTMSITVTPNVTPTFTAVAAICSGATLSALPTTSIEGITGTWAPALNNTATTTYTFTPTAGQCAVTQTMSITVTPNATPTFTPVAAICSGAALAPLPTTSIEGITGTWAPALNNTATTTYTFTPTAGICAVTQTMSITVNPIITPTFTPVAAICSGGTLAPLPTTSIEGITGTWAPALNNTATTTYTFTPTAGQCAVTQTMSITVTPNVTPTFTQVATICSGATLSALPTASIEGITGTWAPALNNTATTTYTFTPTAGQCAVTQTMSITVTPNATPTFTPVAAICSGAALAPLPTTSTNGITGTWAPALNNTATTTYTFTPTAGICAVTQTMSITVNSNVTPTFTQVAAICSGAALAPLPTTSTNGITGTWAPALNNTATTMYTFTPTAGQCAVTQTMSITVNPIITPTFTQVATICSGGSLSALPTTSIEGITGTWSPALNNTLTTTYTFTPTAGQCAVTQTMTITVTPNVTPTFTQVAAICVGAALAPLPTTSNNGITGTWSPAMNNGSTTTYTFTPTAGICATTQTMIITVNPIPSVVLQNGTICLDSAGVPISTHTFDTDLSDATYDFVWYDMATGLPIVPAEIGSTYVATAPGTYGVKITNTATTCSSGIISGVVGTLSAPQSYISIPTSNYFADVQTITVNVSPASGNYEYQIDNGGFQSSNVFTNVGSGTHTIEVRNECGSLPPREVNIVDFPRFFTPNGDGYHDTWNISALNNQSNAKILILDRFGKLLKEIRPSHNGWDGMFNQQSLPSTDYWFVVTYEEGGATKEFRSHFAMKR